jgi:UDP-N-acetylmuramoylalanine--D-glutamate ligase
VLVGGNIGVPLSAQVDASTAGTLHVVEVSSFQLETTTTLRPWIALWINLADDHLDRHADLDEYAAAKARIFANQGPDDFAVINADDPMVMRWSRNIAARTVAFSPSGRLADGYMADGGWIVRCTATSTDRLSSVGVELAAHMLGSGVLSRWRRRPGPAPAMTKALHGFRGSARDGAGDPRRRQFVNVEATNVGPPALDQASTRRGGVVGSRFEAATCVRCGPLARAAARWWPRRGRTARRGGPGRRRPGVTPARCGKPWAWPTRRRCPTGWCSWRRRAPASTGSRTTPSGDARSSRRWNGCRATGWCG